MNSLNEKRKKSLQAELKRIVSVIINDYSPEKIILFGSLASGDIHEWSDIDLAVIKDTNERFIDRPYSICLIADPKIGTDIIVYTPKEFRDMIEANNYFVTDEILKRGKVLYEKAG